MKRYEDVFRLKLPKRIPKVIRIDGRAFHTYTANAKKPYDPGIMFAMREAALSVIEDIGGTARFAYIQSDECSIALNDALTLTTSPWFDNNIQKMVSVAASVFTNTFQEIMSRREEFKEKKAAFDARVILLPDVNELVNYMVWRQQDATRNSILGYGYSMFSHSELDCKSCNEIQEMMFQKHEFNWEKELTAKKRGYIATKDANLNDIPIFTQDRDFLIKLFNPAEEPTNSVTEAPLETAESQTLEHS